MRVSISMTLLMLVLSVAAVPRPLKQAQIKRGGLEDREEEHHGGGHGGGYKPPPGPSKAYTPTPTPTPTPPPHHGGYSPY